MDPTNKIPDKKEDASIAAQTVTSLKKRKRPAATKKAAAKPINVTSSSAASTIITPPPTKILVIDNGGDTVKYGWNTDDAPQVISNITARLPQQWTLLVGDQLQSIQNPNQLFGLTRSTERGMIVNLGNQVHVWKRMLDLLNVAVAPHATSDAAQAFGWKKVNAATANVTAASTCAVLIALHPFCPRSVLDAVVNVWMNDFGFSHVGVCVSTACARSEHLEYSTSLTVDLGWSATHIVPTVGNQMLKRGIRRVPLGGRHLINMMKYLFTYRQWNLMDQEWILRDVLEKAAFVSLNFKQDMQIASRIGRGRRPFDREYLLPDYQETFVGSIRLPAPLLKQLEHELNQESDEEDEEDDSSVDEKDLMEEDIEDDGNDDDEPQQQLPTPSRKKKPSNDSVDADDDEVEDDEEEETMEQVRARLLKQRAEEERRRRDLEQEHQVLQLSVERFSVPECLFRPSDAGLSTKLAGLPQAIVQAIDACEEIYRPALYRSIHLVGGLSQLEGLNERLAQELRSLAPCEYSIGMTNAERPLEQAWLGACKLSKESAASIWSVSRTEWEALGRKGSWKRLVESGQVV
ncbi:hypothetical protein MPSEU_000865400 [Mayamaea pseudoterrestris]|nr:hypothetical protein MPSEU_000865400 [Mayamaea pseudoterrestris]